MFKKQNKTQILPPVALEMTRELSWALEEKTKTKKSIYREERIREKPSISVPSLALRKQAATSYAVAKD